jgi:NADH-quinone oxidoreductase subunit C
MGEMEEENKAAEQQPALSPAAQMLRDKFPEGVEEVTEFRGETTVRVKKENLVDACTFLRDDPSLQFDFLTSVFGVDYPERTPRFDVTYLLYSTVKNYRLRVKSGVGIDEEIPSVTGVWPSANWDERETYDMFGVIFSGHPNLTRILMPVEWEGHPFRKDYPLQGIPGNAERWFEKQLEIPKE